MMDVKKYDTVKDSLLLLKHLDNEASFCRADYIPNDLFAIYFEIFQSSSKVCKLNLFAQQLLMDTPYKLSKFQKKKLIGLFSTTLPAYASDTFILIVGDFVAREYPVKQSVEVVKKAWNSEDANLKKLALKIIGNLNIVLPRTGIERELFKNEVALLNEK